MKRRLSVDQGSVGLGSGPSPVTMWPPGSPSVKWQSGASKVSLILQDSVTPLPRGSQWVEVNFLPSGSRRGRLGPWGGGALASAQGVCFWGDMEEGKVQLPQTHLSPHWLEGIWQLGAMDRATPPTPTSIAQSSVCWVSHHL